MVTARAVQRPGPCRHDGYNGMSASRRDVEGHECGVNPRLEHLAAEDLATIAHEDLAAVRVAEDLAAFLRAFRPAVIRELLLALLDLAFVPVGVRDAFREFFDGH